MLVHSVPLSKKKFTLDDLELSKQYVSTKVYPDLYDNSVLKAKEFEFIDRRIMKIEDINIVVDDFEVFDNLDLKGLARDYFITQHSAIRAGGRGKNADKLCQDINARGYELSHIPISVAECPDGDTYRVDGRTRLEELVKAGFTNVIVDFYVCRTWKAYFTEALKRNPPDPIRSPMTKEDLISQCNFFIDMGWMKKDAPAIEAHVRELTANRINYNTLQKVVTNVMYGSGYTASVLSLDESKADNWLKRCGYINNDKDNGIYYKVVSASAWTKAIAYSAIELEKLKDEGRKVRELRVILHTGTLEGADPAKSWKNKIDSFRVGWKNNLSAIEKSFFSSTTARHIIKLYGAIPAVGALSSEYPMDRLVMFHTGRLANDTYFIQLDEEDDENTPLSEALGIL